MVKTVRLIHTCRWTAPQPHEVTRPCELLGVNKLRGTYSIDLERPLRVGSGSPLDKLDLPRPHQDRGDGYPEAYCLDDFAAAEGNPSVPLREAQVAAHAALS